MQGFKIGEYHLGISTELICPSFSSGILIFGPVLHLNQSVGSEHIWWIITIFIYLPGRLQNNDLKYHKRGPAHGFLLTTLIVVIIIIIILSLHNLVILISFCANYLSLLKLLVVKKLFIGAEVLEKHIHVRLKFINS